MQLRKTIKFELVKADPFMSLVIDTNLILLDANEHLKLLLDHIDELNEHQKHIQIVHLKVLLIDLKANIEKLKPG